MGSSFASPLRLGGRGIRYERRREDIARRTGDAQRSGQDAAPSSASAGGVFEEGASAPSTRRPTKPAGRFILPSGERIGQVMALAAVACSLPAPGSAELQHATADPR